MVERTYGLTKTTVLNKEEFFSLPKKTRETLCRHQLQVTGDYDIVNAVSSKMTNWCSENCTGLVYKEDHVFYFEEETEAAAFKLRWMP